MVRDPTRYCKCMSETRLEDMFCESRPTGLGRDVDDIRKANSAFINTSPFSEDRALSLRKPSPRLRFFSDVDNDGIPDSRSRGPESDDEIESETLPDITVDLTQTLE